MASIGALERSPFLARAISSAAAEDRLVDKRTARASFLIMGDLMVWWKSK
jgi:hypothetical protein